MLSRLFPSSLGLRLKPRGELFISLLAIGLAVALPAVAWVWTTVRTLDRDRRDWTQELQTLHRFRLEEAIRTLDVELKARASRAGHRTQSRVSEAGVLFRDLLGDAGEAVLQEGAPDGLLVLAADGTPLYPALAIGVINPPEVDLRGETLMGAFHQRLLTQSMGDAYLGLAAQWVEQGLEGSRSPSGRLYLPSIELAALQQLSRDDARFELTLESLARRVSRHTAPLMPASQRLFLWRELQRLGARATLPTESAEVLGLAVVQELVGKPDREHPTAKTVHLSADAPSQEVWLIPAPGGGVIWLYQRERLHRELEVQVNRSLAPQGYRAQLVSQRDPVSGVENLQASMGVALPGWALRLDTSVATAELAGSARRQAALQIASAASAVILGAVLSILAVRRFLQRVRLTEVRHDFLTTLSHELRTPMTSIRMLIDTLVADPDLQPDRTRAYLEVVSRETLRLGRLVDDYLTFARLERGGMNYDFQPTAPETVVEAAVRSVESRFAAPGCDFRTEIARELPLIQADAPSLTTALLNLLENAYKYTGADKRILLTVTQSGSTLCFAVIDNGRGFDPRQRSRIFEKFYRAEGTGNSVTGAGLGLHIVKSIVDAHGGRVEVETTPGEGSRFAIHIPVVAADTERHHET